MPEPVEEWARHRPPSMLRPYVAFYSGFRQRGQRPARHVGLPSPYLTVILTLDDPLVVERHPDPAQPAEAYDAMVGGLHIRPATVVHEGAQSGVQIGLSPLGSRALLGLPAGEVAGIDVTAEDVLGPVARRWLDAVRAAQTWPERFAALDEALVAAVVAAGERCGVAAEVHPDVARAWSIILNGAGRVPVGEIAREVSRGERHLRQLFDHEIGLSPKQASRVVRFDRARRMIQEGSHRTLADVAAACGYADHAHLVHDFHDLAGAAPSRWLAEELRNVQVPPVVIAAEWSS
jgi:AraC-like DNA-binding protein